MTVLLKSTSEVLRPDGGVRKTLFTIPSFTATSQHVILKSSFTNRLSSSLTFSLEHQALSGNIRLLIKNKILAADETFTPDFTPAFFQAGELLLVTTPLDAQANGYSTSDFGEYSNNDWLFQSNFNYSEQVGELPLDVLFTTAIDS